MALLSVSVTRLDIARGRGCSPCGCPIALALERATGRVFVVAGWGCRVPGEILGHFPEEAKTFIRHFDGCLPVEPFVFDVDLVDDPEPAEPTF